MVLCLYQPTESLHTDTDPEPNFLEDRSDIRCGPEPDEMFSDVTGRGMIMHMRIRISEEREQTVPRTPNGRGAQTLVIAGTSDSSRTGAAVPRSGGGGLVLMSPVA